MLKKIVSIMLAFVLILSVAVIGVSAETGADNADTNSTLIYFDATGWKNITSLYCHIWERGGDSFYAWKQKATAMKKVKDDLYSFDLSVLERSATISGGIKDGKDYCVIFASSVGTADGPQTYDMTFGRECIGDTAYITGETVENPVDSEKTAQLAAWKNNSDKYGPHLAITSIGNIVGSHFCPNESYVSVIGDWLPPYFNSPNVDAMTTLINVYSEFGIKTENDVKAIYDYIVDNKGDYYQQADLNKMEKMLTRALERTNSGDDETNPTETEQPTQAETKPATENTEPAATEPVDTEPAATKPTEPKKEVKPAAKKANKMKVTVKKPKTVKAKTLKKGKVTVKAITVTKANGTVSFKKVAKKSSKCLTINKKTGKITVKKGTKKGNYKITVEVSAKGNKNYNKKTITKTITIKVK